MIKKSLQKPDMEDKMGEKIWVKMDKKTTIIVVLSLLLVILAGYIGMKEYNNMKTQRELDVFQQGVVSGSDQTLLYLFKQGSSCQPIPLFVSNQTLTMIPIECVFNQAATCQPLAVNVNNKTLNLVAAECLQKTN